MQSSKKIEVGQTKKFLSQSFINLFGNAVASFLAFLFNFLVVKSLTMADYGEYTSVVAYLAFLTAPLTILSLIITKKVSQVTEGEKWSAAVQVKAQFFQLWRKNWTLLLVVPLCWWFLATQVNLSVATSAPTIIVLLLLSLLTTLLTAILTGWQIFVLVVGIAIVTAAVKFGGGLAILQVLPNLNGIYLVLLITTLVQLGLSWWVVQKKLRQKLKTKAERQPKVAVQPWWQYLGKKTIWVPLVGVVVTTALVNVDMMTVKATAGADFAGAYGLYSLFAKILLYASNPLINVAFTFFNQPGADKNKRRTFAVAAVLIGFFTLGMVGLYALWPEQLITVVGKSDYLMLAPVLWWAAIFGGLYSLVLLLTQFLIAKNRRLIYLGLLLPILQSLAIAQYHQTLLQVMLINIGTCVILGAIYGGAIIYKKKKNAATII